MKNNDKKNLRTIGETLKDGLITLDDVKTYFHYDPKLIQFFDQFIGSVKYSDLAIVGRSPGDYDIGFIGLINEIYHMFCLHHVDEDGKFVSEEGRRYIYDSNGMLETVITNTFRDTTKKTFKDGKVDKMLFSNKPYHDEIEWVRDNSCYPDVSVHSYTYINNRISNIKIDNGCELVTFIYDEKLNNVKQIAISKKGRTTCIVNFLYDEFNNETDRKVSVSEKPYNLVRCLHSIQARSVDGYRRLNYKDKTVSYRDTKNSKKMIVDDRDGIKVVYEVIDGVFIIKINDEVKMKLPVGKFK